VVTIGRLAKKHGLSRSTLLYYDRIGLLVPQYREANGYRLYSQSDDEKLAKICLYRRIGINLEEIKRILDSPGNRLVEALEMRMKDLNVEIAGLREQQIQIVNMLRSKKIHSVSAGLTKQSWIGLLHSSGFTDADLLSWHARFEDHSPENHQQFLELLGIPGREIDLIRNEARQYLNQGPLSQLEGPGQ